jgi:serpin B
MRRGISLLLVSAILIGLLGCTPALSGPVLQSDEPRNTSPAVDENDFTELIKGNSAFAFDIYQILRENGNNLFYSPHSISEALAMTYAGARGETEKDMAEALDFTLSQDRLHTTFNSLDLQLEQRGQGAKGKDEEGFRLHVVNAIWGQKDYGFLMQFLDVLAQNYGAGLRILDFINETEQSRLVINKWASDQTEERIKDLVPQGAIDQLTRLVLTDAIYFNAAWQYPFDENATSDGLFHLLNGSDVVVPMMMQTESFGHTEGVEFQAVGQELSMVILLPKPGQFNTFEEELNAEFFESIIHRLERHEVALTMPKFEYESSFGLKQALSTLGMGTAFTTGADFSGMNGKRDLLIQDVLHKAFVSVDEAGTEAAAATAVIVGVTSIPAQPIEVKIDRPFIFLIRDIPTGSIIFVGRVLNPTE